MSGEGVADAGGGTGDAAAQAAAAAAGASKPWHDGVEAELLGHFQSRGLDKMSARDAAISEAKAYREASKLIGAPPESMVRIPKEAADTEGWNKVYDRLGVVRDPAKFDFSTVKFADGTALDEDTIKSFRQDAIDLKLTADGAKDYAKKIVAQRDAQKAAEQTAYTEKLAAEKDTLKKNWGSNYNMNLVTAQNAAKTLGIQPDEIKALEGTVGFSRVLEIMRNIGARTGEDKFVQGGGGGAMTVEQAKSELAMLERDTDWSNKFQNGDVNAVKRFNDLTRMAVGL